MAANVRFHWADRPVMDDVQQAMTAGMEMAGQRARSSIKAELSGPPGSAPGEPPGKLTGELQNAVDYRLFRKRHKYVGVEAGVPRQSPVYPQASRLASGFTGRDRLGRLYSQAARPFASTVLRRDSSRLGSAIKDGAARLMPQPKDRR